jgi:hypothetical protein
MKKVLLTMICLFVLVFALSGISYGWQGRMGGMGDPFGLVQDESDFLIHPAKIANGEGIRFYGDYRFTYIGVTDWNDRWSHLRLSGALIDFGQVDVSGQELGHNALVGAAFPVGPGRMGLFFTYGGMRGDYDGKQNEAFFPDFQLEFVHTYELHNDLDNFAWRLLYGLPIGGFKLGAEAQLAYRQELQELNRFSSSEVELNFWRVPYPFPNKSSYLKALFKGSVEGKIGPFDLEFTLRGGLDLPGTNSSEWDFEDQTIPDGTLVARWNANGEVHGWEVGGDLWLRYALAPDLTLPILLRADYREKSRDGFGPENEAGFNRSVNFRDEVRDLAITVGGGVDKEIGKVTRLAAGIYYNYLQGKENFTYTRRSLVPSPFFVMEDLTYPDSVEHQLLLRLAGEHTLSPAVALRAGLNIFYGWLLPQAKSFRMIGATPDFSDEDSGHGYDWGIGASVGGTVKVKPLTLEPFVGGGYRQRHLQVHGVGYVFGTRLVSDVVDRNEWSIGGGLSVLYDL